jgi:hypothetical protein
MMSRPLLPLGYGLRYSRCRALGGRLCGLQRGRPGTSCLAGTHARRNRTDHDPRASGQDSEPALSAQIAPLMREWHFNGRPFCR